MLKTTGAATVVAATGGLPMMANAFAPDKWMAVSMLWPAEGHRYLAVRVGAEPPIRFTPVTGVPLDDEVVSELLPLSDEVLAHFNDDGDFVFIDGDYIFKTREPKLTLEEMADYRLLPTSYVSRLGVVESSMSIGNAVQQRRARARQQLAASPARPRL